MNCMRSMGIYWPSQVWDAHCSTSSPTCKSTYLLPHLLMVMVRNCKFWLIGNVLTGSFIADTFKNALGDFALPHTDENDDGAGLTAMALLPSVPDDYSMGIFAYHDFKIFMKPTGSSIVFFTGRHRHGGTAPSPPPGVQSKKWAYRLTVICYPNAATIRGTSRLSLHPSPGGEVYNLPPEIRFRRP